MKEIPPDLQSGEEKRCQKSVKGKSLKDKSEEASLSTPKAAKGKAGEAINEANSAGGWGRHNRTLGARRAVSMGLHGVWVVFSHL